MTPLKRKAGRILAAAPWAGSKRTLAPRINAELGPHTHYYAPFVGGFSTEMQKPRCAVEVVNDANPKIVNVLKMVREKGQILSDGLSIIDFSEINYRNAVEGLNRKFLYVPAEPCPFARALDQLILWWMGPGGLAGTTQKGWFAKRHTNTGGCPSRRWESFKASIPAIAERLQAVVVEQRHFKHFMLTVPDREGVAVYCDPPYFSKSFQYEVDFELSDHYLLALILNDFKRARIVVSYRDEPHPDGGTMLDRLYPRERWRRVELETSKNMASASGKAKRNVEVLLVNDKEG